MWCWTCETSRSGRPAEHVPEHIMRVLLQQKKKPTMRLRPNDPEVGETAAAYERLRAAGFGSGVFALPVLMLRFGRLLRQAPKVAYADRGGSSVLDRHLVHALGPCRIRRPLMSILNLPSTSEEYLRGRYRERVRGNLRKAASAGYRASVVGHQAEAMRCIAELLAHRSEEGVHPERAHLPEGGDLRVVVRDAEERVIAMASIAIDGADAYVQMLVSASDLPSIGPARYLAHTAVVEELIALGCQRLWADGAVTLPSGVRHFQHLLGYELARPGRPSRPTKVLAGVGSAS